MKKLLDTLPLVIFVTLIIVLFSFLSNEDNQLETVLIDESFPEFSLTSLTDTTKILAKSDISELPALINVWATWCIACKVEHPFLMIRRPPRSTQGVSSAASDVYKRQRHVGVIDDKVWKEKFAKYLDE